MNKLCIALSVFLCLVSLSVFAADEAEMLNNLTAHEKILWEAIKNKNMDAFSAGTAPDILSIDAMGAIFNKQGLIAEFGKFTMNTYTLSDFKLYMLDKNAAVLSYTADMNATMNGQTMTMKVTHTTTYIEKDGKWWPKFHTETPVTQPPPAPTQ